MNTFLLLRLIHLILGAFWAGTLLFMALFLVPTIRASGPAGGAIMRGLAEKRHLPQYMLASAWGVVLSGAGLAWLDAGALGWAWFQRGIGLSYGIGAVLSVAAMVVGSTVNSPTASRISALMSKQEGPPPPDVLAEVGRLQQRLELAVRVVALLVVGALAMMALARFMP